MLLNCDSIDQNRMNAEKKNTLGLIEFRNGNSEGAKEYFLEAVQLDPKNPEYASNVGASLLIKERVEEAIVFFAKSVEIDPQYKMGYFNLGVSYQKLNKRKAALENYKKAFSNDFPEAFYNAGIVASSLKSGKEAIEYYEKFIELAEPLRYGAQIKDAHGKIREITR
ncbi:tetratricopeptide repeat protein [Leptospira inadai serovar Lyme]|uniref:Tetratricopeptide repeat protein n=1 Tax=Leptospira inadai serovar Lyme TaxID=293084 RepID=A0ABX4YFN9_9LEPT|nr:tetratricopeptide repeat protein [Leptospira inadai serovar Lyme]